MAMIPIQVTLQYIREGAKEAKLVQLSIDQSVREAILKLVEDLELPTEYDDQPIHYELLRQRQLLDRDELLFRIGVQDGDILQLMRIDSNSTISMESGRALSSNLLNRMGGKNSGEPLPLSAALMDRSSNRIFRLQHTRALIGRADANLGYPSEALDADLTDLDTERSVSRPHALIVYSNQEFTIRDLYSQHGLFVNNLAVPPNKSHILHHGDVLRFGDVELQFVCEE